MIKPKCDYCGNELAEMGGILLSPPNEDSMVKKYHICINCYSRLLPTITII